MVAEAPAWVRKSEYAYFVTQMLTEPGWMNWPFALIGMTPIGAVCEQPHDPSFPPTTGITASSSHSELSRATPFTPPTGGSKCDTRNKGYYTKTGQYENNGRRICYFVVPGATDESNDYVVLWKAIHVKVATARSICQQHGATLPVIWEDAENDFVLQNFEPKDYDATGTFKKFDGVLLGMRVTGGWNRVRHSVYAIASGLMPGKVPSANGHCPVLGRIYLGRYQQHV